MFTDRELLLILNSLHERGMHLLDMSGAMASKHYRTPRGEKVSKDDIDKIYNGHKEHLDLVEKVRGIRECTT